jgi:CheY-like chemotaxis protein/HPt (histidine-containing phosphotransfer) domain-containing protein
MNGEIVLASTPGEGSTFTFTLPFAVGTSTKMALPAVAHPLTNKRVLVVDDNEINRCLLMHLLPQWGLQPVCAENGFEALELLKKSLEERKAFSLVLLDQDMPGMNGFETAEKIQQVAGKERPAIVILSSSSSPADQARSKKLGIEGRLLKPLRRGTLHETILHALKLPVTPDKTPNLEKEIRKPRRLRLLLAEDNRMNQKLASRLLEKMGHEVSLAVNGKEALEMLRQKSFDMILMDIQMPVMGGVEATRWIREEEQKSGGHIPIIAVTAHAMAGDAEKYLQSGMDGYVSKPIRTGFLRAEIERVAKSAGQQEVLVMKEAEKVSPGVALDFAELLGRVENDRELLRDLPLIFKDEFPRHLHSLREAVESMDSDRVSAAAHTIKGMLLNLAAPHAAAAAAHLERLGRDGKASAFHKSFALLESEAAKVLLFVEVHMTEVCS